MSDKEQKLIYAIGEEVYVAYNGEVKKSTVKYIYEFYDTYNYQLIVPGIDRLITRPEDELGKSFEIVVLTEIKETEYQIELYERWLAEAKEKVKKLREKPNK